MQQSDVILADRLGKRRAVLFYLMALVLVVTAWLGVGVIVDDELRVTTWAVAAVIAIFNLTPLATWLRPRALKSLLDDESTRDHRRSAFQAGFWAAIVSATVMSCLWPGSFVFGIDVARIVVTAAFASALIAFATLELRAGRG